MLHFAVAGVPLGTKKGGGTVEGLEYAHSIGIQAMEMEWVQRVPGNPERMAEIRETAERLKMVLTVHAPYYINLNSDDEAKLAASKKRIIDALTMAELAGARSVCVHAAFNQGKKPEEVYENMQRATEDILKHKKQFPHTNLAYETMGKHAQWGTLEECLRLSKEFDLYPTIDPAHMHARSNGGWNTTKEWEEMFDMYESYLGKKSLSTMHMHFSGIEYNGTGERRHLPIQESDAKWKDFLRVLKKKKIGGVLVSESPLLEEDTLLLKNAFDKL